MKKLLLAATMLSAIPSLAMAAVTTFDPKNGAKGISIEGEILPGDFDLFAGIVKNCCSEAGKNVVVQITGPGGNMLAGLRWVE